VPPIGHYAPKFDIVYQHTDFPKLREETKAEYNRDNVVLPVDTKICSHLINMYLEKKPVVEQKVQK
jgi:hypothetical protein